MESRDMFVCNGRSPSDTPANYTYLSTNGNTTLDLVWVNSVTLDKINDFEVINLTGLSSHLLCALTLNYNTRPYKNQEQTISGINECIKWDDSKSAMFKYNLNCFSNIYFNSKDVNQLNNNMLTVLYKSAINSNIVVKKQLINNKSNSNSKKNDQVWYNSQLRELKRQVKHAYKSYKHNVNNIDLLHNYLNIKKNYKQVLNKVKAEYYIQIMSKFANIKNSKEFWTTVKLYTGRPPQNLSDFPQINVWVEFFKTIYPPKNNHIYTFYSVCHPFLDRNIELDELQFSIKQTKINKSPGIDKVPNELFKNLSPEWEHYLLNMFNTIMENEEIPDLWAKVNLTLLYKKGDRSNPENYRGIALINNVCKLFTKILTKRIMEWAESSHIIPEEQGGFRKDRGCLDHIFTLNAMISIHTKKKKSYIHGIFVDFKRAFDSIDQDKLWSKLYYLGVSGKLIRLLKNLYDKAGMFLKNELDMREIRITQGLLQGDSLSPLLFILFISDIITYFEENGSSGLSINSKRDLVMLLFADDIIILSQSWHDTINKFKILDNYCKNNSIFLNPDKTKVVPFSQSSRCKKFKNVFWRENQLNYEKEYIYLGVPFSSNFKFKKAAEYFLSKVSPQIGKIINILSKSKCKIWDTRMRLFDAIASSTLLYGAEIWAFEHLHAVERGQVKFLKQILCWPSNTPDYIVRLETERPHLSVTVFKKVITYWIRIMGMESDRLPKLCFNRLKELHSLPNNRADRNWFTLLGSWLNIIGEGELIYCSDVDVINRKRGDLVEKWTNHVISKDIERVMNSSYSSIYREISGLGRCEQYVKFDCCIEKLRVVSQLRVSWDRKVRVWWKNGGYHCLDTLALCTMCNLSEPETLRHFLLQCPIYSPIRNHYLSQYIVNNDSLADLLLIQTQMKLNKLYYYTVEALKLRSFILNE